MIVLKNETLQVKIAEKGAELQSIYNKSNKLEYMWQADPAFWSKHSPILFPIVGTLKDNTYKYQEKEYHLPRHGFARERLFLVEQANEYQVTFLLTDDEETKKIYPFSFELRVHYVLDGTSLQVTYEVHNLTDGEMYYSVGGHPAFKVPLEDGHSYDDYYLDFSETEHAPRYTLQEGLIDNPQPFLQYEKRINLSHELFYEDAIVVKHLRSENVVLKTDKSEHGLQFDFSQFPFLGIWAFKDADFVCIEPWQGIADHTSHNQELTEKEGIVKLEKGQRQQHSWTVTLF